MISILRHPGFRFSVATIVLVILCSGPSHTQSQAQVGFGEVGAGDGSAVATALFSLESGGILVSEAGVGAVQPLSTGRIFVDQDGTETGLALANPSEQEVAYELVLRDANGELVATLEDSLGPRQHLARFVSELFEEEFAGGGLVGFTGSLTILTTDPDETLAAVTLRQSTNALSEPVFATLPVAPVAGSVSTLGEGISDVVFPHLGAGGILSTQLILINPSSSKTSGRIRLTSSDGEALVLELDGVSGSEFGYVLEPDGVFRGTLTSSDEVFQGYATVSVEEGTVAPAGTAIFQFRDINGALVSEAGVGAGAVTSRARIFVDTVGTQTGVALASPGNDAQSVTLRLLDRNGFQVDASELRLPANGHTSVFANGVGAVFEDLPEGFTGLLELEAEYGLVPITLKLTTNARGDFILTTLPVADLEAETTPGTLVFPQIGFGLGFSTRLIFVNPDSATVTGTLTLTESDGTALEASVPGGTASTFPITLPADGARQVRPGNTAEASTILADLFNPGSQEVVVGLGETSQLTPLVIDSTGAFRDDFEFSYSSLDPAIASVTTGGLLEGVDVGFSTVSLSTNGLLATVTATVAQVVSSTSAFQIDGLTEDESGQLFLASSNAHVLLRSESVGEASQLYAGERDGPGFTDSSRLLARFRGPSFIVSDAASGLLYVSDTSNHSIRVLDPVSEEVSTLAGTGSSGFADGELEAARLSGPLGLAFDRSGNLWFADSGNHVIRRIDLTDGTVETIAGSAGSAGFEDGTGTEARFDSPAGIAFEEESVADQLQREILGEPPPEVTIIVADLGNGAIRRVSASGLVETVSAAGATTAGDAQAGIFQRPVGVAVDAAGRIFVADAGDDVLRVVDLNGNISTASPPRTFSSLRGLSVGRDGRLLAGDSLGGTQIQYGVPEIDFFETVSDPEQGNVVSVEGRNFGPDTRPVIPGATVRNLEVLDTGRLTFQFDAPLAPDRGVIQPFSLVGRSGIGQQNALVTPDGGLGDGFFIAIYTPTGLALDMSGNLYIASEANVDRFLLSSGVAIGAVGSVPGFAGDGGPARSALLDGPPGLAVGRRGDLFIADSLNHRIRVVRMDTRIIQTLAGTGTPGFAGDGGPAREAQFNQPSQLALDEPGNLYIVDSENHRIRRIDAETGLVSTVAGTGVPGFSGDDGDPQLAQLNGPTDIAAGPPGVIFVSDTGNHRVRRIDLNRGVIETIAGTGLEDSSGDGGPATMAAVQRPLGVALDRRGNLFVASQFVVRRVNLETGVIDTYAGTGEQGGFVRDVGRPATEVAFSAPSALETDGAGNLFILEEEQFGFITVVDAVTGILRLVPFDSQLIS